jgi:hypothetical protein
LFQNDKLLDYLALCSDYSHQTQTESLSLCDKLLYVLHEVSGHHLSGITSAICQHKTVNITNIFQIQ